MNPDPMIGEFCKTVLETTRSGGNVLVPCYPAGVVYDLLECLAGQMDLHGQQGVPMFFVSPVAGALPATNNVNIFERKTDESVLTSLLKKSCSSIRKRMQ